MTVLSFVRVLQSAKACRLCRERHEEGNVDVFPSDPIEDASTSNDILEALHKYISLTIKEDDGLGSIICMHCLFTLQLLSELVKDYNTNRDKVVANKFDCCYVCSMKTSFFFYGRQYCRYLKKLIKYSQPNVFSDVKETKYVMRRFCKECTFKVETTYKFQKKARLTEKRLRSLPYESDFSSADDESDFERSQNEPEDAMVGSGHIHVSRFGNDAFFYHHRRISPVPRMGSVSPASSTSSLSLPDLEVMASTSTQPTSSTSSSNRPTRRRPPKKKTVPCKKKVQRRRKAKNVNKDNDDSDSDYDNNTAVHNRRVTKTSGKVTKKSKRSINRTKIRTSLRLQNANANSNTSNITTSTQRKNNNGGKSTKKSSRGRRKV